MVKVIDNENGLALQVHYDGVGEAFDLAHDAPRCADNFATLNSDYGAWGGTWADRRSKAWMNGALRSADADTMRSIDEMRERISAAIPSLKNPAPRRTRVRRQEVGDEINGDRFLARSTECWDRMTRTAKPTRTIKIAVEYSVHCGQRRDELLPRGAALCALAQWLVQNGYSVEIHGVWFVSGFYASRYSSSNALSTVVVKPSRTPLDMGALATALCEIAYARKVTLTGMVVKAAEEVSGGWGRPERLPEATKRELGYEITVGTNINSAEDAAKWLSATVAKLTGEQEAA